MADFTRHSNYNKECGFASIVFGANSPVLEVELNELQQILNHKLELFFKYWGNAVLPLGEDLYSITDGRVTLKNCSVLCDGKIIYIKETSIPIDYDVDFGYISVKVEKERVVTHSSTLTCFGDKNGYVVDNTIMDNRNPIETTRRTVIPYELVFSNEVLQDTEEYTYVLVMTLSKNSETGEFEEEVISTDTVSALKEQLTEQLGGLQESVDEVKTEVSNTVKEVEKTLETARKEIDENVTNKIKEVDNKVTTALETAKEFSFIRHDDTGELFRIGINNSGLYVVKYEEPETPPSGDEEAITMMLNLTDEERDIKTEIDNVERNVDNATTQEDEVTDNTYLFKINS